MSNFHIKLCTFSVVLSQPDDGLAGRNMLLNYYGNKQLLCLIALTVILTTRRKSCVSANLFITNPMWIAPCSNPNLHVEQPAGVYASYV